MGLRFERVSLTKSRVPATDEKKQLHGMRGKERSSADRLIQLRV